MIAVPTLFATHVVAADTVAAAMTLPVASALVANPGKYTRPRPPGPLMVVLIVKTTAFSSGRAGLALVPGAAVPVLLNSIPTPLRTSRSVTLARLVVDAKNAAYAVQVPPVVIAAKIV